MKFLIFFFVVNSYASLTCSQNGTMIYFLNGINVSSKLQSNETVDLVSKYVQPKKNEIDIKLNVEFSSFYNFSNGLFADIQKLNQQLILDKISTNVSDLERRKVFELQAESQLNSVKSLSGPYRLMTNVEREKIKDKLKKTFDYIYSDDFSNLSFSDFQMKKLEIVKNLEGYENIIKDSVLNAASDQKVTSEIIKTISNDIEKENKKVIFITHSQGNEALRTAYLQMKNSSQYDMSRVYNSLGALQVAPPSPELVFRQCEGIAIPNDLNYPCKSREIKLDTDLVISQSGLLLTTENIPIAPNYSFASNESKLSFLSGVPLIGNLANYFVGLSYNGFHSMNDIYLNDKVYARKIASLDHQAYPMTDIFTSNLVNVAESLSDNCKKIRFNFDAPNSLKNYNEFNYFVNYVPSAEVTVSDLNSLNGDTEFEWFDVEGKVKLNVGEKFNIDFDRPGDYKYLVKATNIYGKTDSVIYTIRVGAPVNKSYKINSHTCFTAYGSHFRGDPILSQYPNDLFNKGAVSTINYTVTYHYKNPLIVDKNFSFSEPPIGETFYFRAEEGLVIEIDSVKLCPYGVRIN